MGIYDLRKENLQKLIAQRYDGVIKKLCTDMGVAHNTIWRLVADSKHSRNIGEDLARRIEEATGVPSGYLDLNEADQVDAEVSDMARRISALPKRNREALMEMLSVIEARGSSE